VIRKLREEDQCPLLTDQNSTLPHSQDQEDHRVLQEHQVHKAIREPGVKSVNLEPLVCLELEVPQARRVNLEKMVKMDVMVNRVQKDREVPRVIQDHQAYQVCRAPRATEGWRVHQVKREILEEREKGVTMVPLVQLDLREVLVLVVCPEREGPRERTDLRVNEVQMGSQDPLDPLD